MNLLYFSNETKQYQQENIKEMLDAINVRFVLYNGFEYVEYKNILFYYRTKHEKEKTPLIGLSRNNRYFVWHYLHRPQEIYDFLSSFSEELAE